MRLIDADELIRYGKCGTLVYWEDIDDAPSIDIVRCGECKYTDFCEKKIHRHGIAYSIDFCSYGSSSEKPNNSND